MRGPSKAEFQSVVKKARHDFVIVEKIAPGMGYTQCD